jgi:hypothetical protein
MATFKVGTGNTTSGSTAWQVYNPAALYVDVDTSAAKFSSTPVYVASIGGNGAQWQVAGVNAIYFPTATGFRVYIRWLEDGSPLTPATANGFGWFINWIGVGS